MAVEPKGRQVRQDNEVLPDKTRSIRLTIKTTTTSWYNGNDNSDTETVTDKHNLDNRSDYKARSDESATAAGPSAKSDKSKPAGVGAPRGLFYVLIGRISPCSDAVKGFEYKMLWRSLIGGVQVVPAPGSLGGLHSREGPAHTSPPIRPSFAAVSRTDHRADRRLRPCSR